MEIKKKELLVCPDCGCRLEFKYAYKDERTGEDRTVYYCPEGDEHHIDGGIRFCRPFGQPLLRHT